jgi:gamma-glutamyltranspeptidase/glutathione hydrolase
VLEGASGQAWCLDANGPAPTAAHERMYEIVSEGERQGGINETEYGCRVKENANVHGPLAVGVPGTLAGIGLLSERWGRLKWPDLIAPSLRLLEDGFPYGATADAILNNEAVIRKFEPTAQHLMPEGRVPKPDDVWRRKDMEKTLARLASAGWRDFYEGEIGRRIADYIQSAGGLLTREDMAGFRPRITAPFATSYRNAQVYGPTLPSGGLSTMQILHMLECFDPISDQTATYWHRLAEILKLAWRDRLRYVGDPDFVDVPVARLLSKDYAAGRVETLRGSPDHVDRLPSPPGGTVPETLHVSAADADGNLVSATLTHGGAFGSCVTVPGAGIILGHGMCRLDPHPGRANSVGPRKRPLHNTAPLVLRLPDRDVAEGLPGGRRIVSVSAQVAHRIVDFGATSHQAATAPRIHAGPQEPVTVSDTLSPALIQALIAMGHEVQAAPGVGGGVQCAEVLKREGRVRAGGNTWAAGAE